MFCAEVNTKVVYIPFWHTYYTFIWQLWLGLLHVYSYFPFNCCEHLPWGCILNKGYWNIQSGLDNAELHAKHGAEYHGNSNIYVIGAYFNDRDNVHIGLIHCRWQNIPSPCIDLYYETVPHCHFGLQDKSIEMPESCCVLFCNTHKAKTQKRVFIKS